MEHRSDSRGGQFGRLGFFYTGLIALGLLGLEVRPAASAEGLFLTWDGCPQGGGTGARTSPCDDDGGENALYCSFGLSSPLDQVLTIEAVVDLQAGDTALPDWWQLGVGGCREGSLAASQDFTGEPGCTDPWQNQATALIQDYIPGQPRGGAGQARIKAVVFVPPTSTVSLDEQHAYYGVKLLLSNAKTTAPSGCAGCHTRVCMVLNAIWVKRVPGAPGGDHLIEASGPTMANWATWQNATNLDCLAVPARHRTWGQIKSLYR